MCLVTEMISFHPVELCPSVLSLKSLYLDSSFFHYVDPGTYIIWYLRNSYAGKEQSLIFDLYKAYKCFFKNNITEC